jgi:hypothetical protein
MGHRRPPQSMHLWARHRFKENHTSPPFVYDPFFTVDDPLSESSPSFRPLPPDRCGELPTVFYPKLGSPWAGLGPWLLVLQHLTAGSFPPSSTPNSSPKFGCLWAERPVRSGCLRRRGPVQQYCLLFSIQNYYFPIQIKFKLVKFVGT